MKPLRILLLNQCFHPDHVSTAQHLTDLARGLVEAGHDVTAVASSRGYDDPTIRYPIRESWRGITIRRIWTPGLGKAAFWRRIIDSLAFWFNTTLLLLRLSRFDVTVCLTSPPLISTLGTAIAALKGGAVVPWVMDLNPDEAVVAGVLKKGGLPERLMSAAQNWSFRRAARIMALDRFMAARLEQKGIDQAVIHTDPPWSHDTDLSYDEPGRVSFRATHGLEDKFVVMYSGNHSPCHPLDTLLQAALRLKDDGRFHFAFIGGGSQFPKVKQFASEQGLKNVLCLPYQPIEKLSASLSSADLHAVLLGDPFVGIVHPCKIYNILTLGMPFVAIGPAESHLSDIVERLHEPAYAHALRHGQVEELVMLLQTMVAAPQEGPSRRLRQFAREFSVSNLRPRFMEVVQDAAKTSPTPR